MLRLLAAGAALGATFTGLTSYLTEMATITNMAKGSVRPPAQPPVFRLGSGARVSEPWPPASANTSSSFVLTKSAKVKVQHVEGRMLRSGSRKAEASSIGKSGTVW